MYCMLRVSFLQVGNCMLRVFFLQEKIALGPYLIDRSERGIESALELQLGQRVLEHFQGLQPAYSKIIFSTQGGWNSQSVGLYQPSTSISPRPWCVPWAVERCTQWRWRRGCCVLFKASRKPSRWLTSRSSFHQVGASSAACSNLLSDFGC